jgi:hypothetical protein
MSPILLGCKTKVPKIVSTSIGALQRLVALQAVPQVGAQMDHFLIKSA